MHVANLHESSSLDNTGIVLGGTGASRAIGVYKLTFVFFSGGLNKKTSTSAATRKMPQLHLTLDGEPLASTITSQRKDRHIIFHDSSNESEVFDVFLMLGGENGTAQDSLPWQKGVLQASFCQDDDDLDGLGSGSFAASNGQIRGLLSIQKVF